jgi:drug/metabolite transporter (DMT)-like permease
MRQLLPGILFAMLWASASVATKFGIHSGDPLVLATVRFLIGGSLMLGYAYLRPGRSPWPRGAEWRHLLVFSVLNTSLYLGAFVLAMREVSAGIGSLSARHQPAVHQHTDIFHIGLRYSSEAAPVELYRGEAGIRVL